MKWIKVNDSFYSEEYCHKSLDIRISKIANQPRCWYSISCFGNMFGNYRTLKSAKQFARNYYKYKANKKIKELKDNLRKL